MGNDTVATRGNLWGFAYRFDRAPDRLVKIARDGSTLRIGSAGSAVSITVDRGCTLHTLTPASIDLDRAPRA